MSNLQNVFDSCQNLYKSIHGLLKTMAEEYAEYVKDGDWDPDLTTYKFDIVLQYSLLQIAAADFDFDWNEMIFIRDLTVQGDIVEYWNKTAKTFNMSGRISWESLYNADVLDLRRFLRASHSNILELSDEVVLVFAVADAVHTEHDYASMCEDGILTLIQGLGLMDGAYTEEEDTEPNVILDVFDRIKAFTSTH